MRPGAPPRESEPGTAAAWPRGAAPAARALATRRVLALMLALAAAGPAVAATAPGGAAQPAAPAPPWRINPHPVRLLRPAAGPDSALARLGRRLFFDRSLSASGRMSCASCHDPRNAFAAPNGRAVQLGGPRLDRPGLRAVPSLEYLEREPPFSIGPDAVEADAEGPAPAPVATSPRGPKRAGSTAPPALVPQGGLFRDGRADTLAQQALGPLLNPDEMALGGVDAVAARLRRAGYARAFAALFGRAVLDDPRRLVDEAMSALARFEVEDRAFHPYDSKYDAWLEGRAVLSPAEARGRAVFDDPRRGNCAACHLDRPGPDGEPPLFTDTQYEALGVPRNPAIAANRDPAFHDLGLCGPVRHDLGGPDGDGARLCGMFRTPSLRNVARRRVWFHNGVEHTLLGAIDFYRLRDSAPQRIYPRGADGRVIRFDDLPPALRGRVDTADAPFGAASGARPAFSAADARDLAAFLRTLDDGWTGH